MGIHLVVSRPGMGRTKYLVDRANHLVEEGKHVLFVTVNATASQLVEDYGLYENVAVIENARIHPKILKSLFHISAYQVVVMDSFESFINENHKPITTRQEYESTFLKLQDICSEFHADLHVTRQLPSDVENGDNRRPTLEDLYPHEYSTVSAVGLYRDEVFLMNSPKENIIDVIDLKTGTTHEHTYQFPFEKSRAIYS